MAMCLSDLVPESHDLAGGPNFLFKCYIGMSEGIEWDLKGDPLSQQSGSTTGRMQDPEKVLFLSDLRSVISKWGMSLTLY